MSKKSTKSRNSRKSSTIRSEYIKQREEFYQKHPHSRMLLGILIVAFAMAIGVLYYNKNQVYVGLSLDEQGINYPYVE